MTGLVIPLPVIRPVPEALQREALRGGVYDAQTALILMNSHFFVGERDGEIGIYRVEDDGGITFLQNDQFLLLLGNIFVKLGGTGADTTSKTVPVAKFWLSHPDRRTCRRIVFDPGANVETCDYNLWRGFAISPQPGFRMQARLLQHIYRIVCRRDKIKFKYVMKYLGWTVQNPHRHAEVVVVLKSEAEGCGKSTVGFVMLEIFGPRHGLLVDNKEQLIGTFNAHLETTCFVLGEEMLWAGDPKTADLVKSRVTASLIPIEAKYRQQRQVPNRLHVMLTTNHDWAVSAGMNARRYFVADVSDEVAQDKKWFDPLYADLKSGGTAEFLNLQRVASAASAAEQQTLSGLFDPRCSRHSRCRAQALKNTRLTGMVGVRSNYPARCSRPPILLLSALSGMSGAEKKKKLEIWCCTAARIFWVSNPANPATPPDAGGSQWRQRP